MAVATTGMHFVYKQSNKQHPGQSSAVLLYFLVSNYQQNKHKKSARLTQWQVLEKAANHTQLKTNNDCMSLVPSASGYTRHVLPPTFKVDSN